MTKYNYTCRYCNKHFIQEKRFLQHRCKQMIRHELFETAEGQTAWLCYQKWMKLNKHHTPKASAFLNSRYFNSFVRFTQFVKKVGIPDVDLFIKLMKQKDFTPTLWTNDQVYVQYIEYMDRKAPPLTQARITIRTLLNLADEFECDVSTLFDQVTPNEIIHLLRQRRLSPWILLHSSKFTNFFITRVSNDEKIIMESIIRPEYWGGKFKDKQTDVQQMLKFVRELKL